MPVLSYKEQIEMNPIPLPLPPSRPKTMLPKYGNMLFLPVFCPSTKISNNPPNLKTNEKVISPLLPSPTNL